MWFAVSRPRPARSAPAKTTGRGALLIAVLAAGALAVSSAPALAAPGDLDSTFGTGGKLTFAPPGLSLTGAADVAVQPDGKVVFVGSGYDGTGEQDFFATRVNTNGALDGTFGNGGVTILDFNGVNTKDTAAALALQPDGKVVVAGQTESLSDGTLDAAVARLDADGKLDPAFGMKTFGGVPNVGDQAYDVAVSNGKILLAGTRAGNFWVTRLNGDGSPDGSLNGGANSSVEVDFGTNKDWAWGVAVQPDGAIVLAGSGVGIGAVARVTPSSGIDTGFAQGGKRTFTGPNPLAAFDTAIESDGNILLAGVVGAGEDFALTRLTRNGSLATTLNGGDTATVDFGQNDDAVALALQANGKILLAGLSGANMAVARLQPGGTADTAFAAGGKEIIDFGGSSAEGVVVASDGKIVLGGAGGPGVAAARLLGDPVAAGGGPGGGGTGGTGGTGGGGTGGSGTSSVPRCGGRRATIVGTSAKDRLRGTRRADVIVGLAGNDRITGLAGNDIICGGAGNDKITGGAGNDRLSGDAGKDSVAGDKGNDRLAGGAGVDSLTGGDGKDKLNGNAGKDRLNGGKGNDSCAGKDAEKSC